MRAKEEQKQWQELETTLKLLEEKLLTDENQCLIGKRKRNLEAVANAMKKVKNLLNLS